MTWFKLKAKFMSLLLNTEVNLQKVREKIDNT